MPNTTTTTAIQTSLNNKKLKLVSYLIFSFLLNFTLFIDTYNGVSSSSSSSSSSASSPSFSFSLAPSTQTVFAQLEQNYPHLKFNPSQIANTHGRVTVPINVVSRTLEYRPEAPRPPVQPAFVEVEPNISQLNLLFNSRSNSVVGTNTAQPHANRPGTSIYVSSSGEPSFQLVQTANKPSNIIQEYSQFFRPIQYTTSVLRPVKESFSEGRHREAQSQSNQAQFHTFPRNQQNPVFVTSTSGNNAFEHAREILEKSSKQVSQSDTGYGSQIQVSSKPLVFTKVQKPAQSSYSSSYSSSSTSSSGTSSSTFSPSNNQISTNFNFSSPQQQEQQQQAISFFSNVQVKPTVGHVIQTTQLPASVSNVELQRNNPIHVQQQQVQPLQSTQEVNRFEKLTVPVITRRVQDFSSLPFAVPQLYIPQSQQFQQVQVQPQITNIQTRHKIAPTYYTVRTVQVRPLVTETTLITPTRQITKQTQSISSVRVQPINHETAENVQTLGQNQNAYLFPYNQQQQHIVQPNLVVQEETEIPATVNFQPIQPQPSTTVNRQIKYSTTQESSEENSSTITASGSLPASAGVQEIPAETVEAVANNVSENSVEGNQEVTNNQQLQSSVDYSQPAINSISSSDITSTQGLTSSSSSSSPSAVFGSTYEGDNYVIQPAAQLSQQIQQTYDDEEVDSSPSPSNSKK